MKRWENPEVKVFSVKMDENIAASGEQILNIRHNQRGVMADNWERYDYRVANGVIADTTHRYIDSSGVNFYYFTQATAA